MHDRLQPGCGALPGVVLAEKKGLVPQPISLKLLWILPYNCAVRKWWQSWNII